MKLGTTDEELLRRFVGGDRSALGALARRYEDPLLGLSAGLLGGQDALARDAVQETWLRVIRFGESFNGRAGFKTWLYRIAINQCRSLQAARPPAASDHPAAARTRAEPTPDASAQEAERTAALHAAVESLVADRRLVVLLCYHEGMTHAEAADILEIPLGTLKSRLHAALTELRERLGGETE